MSLSRREFLAATGGGLAAVATTSVLTGRVWPNIIGEDLVPGIAEHIDLAPRAWTTTPDAVSFAVIGDNGSGGRQAMAVASRMARTYQTHPFGTVLLLGDISYYGDFDDRFDAVFARPMGPLIEADVHFELALGNHDQGIVHGDPSLAAIEAKLDLLDIPHRYYTTTEGPADLFFLDSSTPGILGEGGNRQLQWLDDALQTSTNRWKIVCLHHPLYSSGHRGSSHQLRAVLEPILRRHHVDLVLSGHDHDYERSLPIDGITHVVSGGGCKTRPVGRSAFTATAEAALHFLHIDIQEDLLTGTAIRADGSVADSIQLRARAG